MAGDNLYIFHTKYDTQHVRLLRSSAGSNRQFEKSTACCLQPLGAYPYAINKRYETFTTELKLIEIFFFFCVVLHSKITIGRHKVAVLEYLYE